VAVASPVSVSVVEPAPEPPIRPVFARLLRPCATALPVRVTRACRRSGADLVDKVRTRSLSNLAALDDNLFDEGCLALERDADARAISFPLVEHLDLVVFRSDRDLSEAGGGQPTGCASIDDPGNR
jgi:hypothetical protein